MKKEKFSNLIFTIPAQLTEIALKSSDLLKGWLGKIKNIGFLLSKRLLSGRPVSVLRGIGGFWPSILIFLTILAVAAINSWDEKSLAGQLNERIMGGPIAKSAYNISRNALVGPNQPIIDIPSDDLLSQSPSSGQESKKAYPGYYLIPTTGINWGEIHPNNAVDIANRCGTEIFASAEGLIAEAGSINGYGNYIIIQHPNGTETLYAHLSKILAEKGDYANRGQVIGLMGNTGRSTGCHLHFEIRGAANPFGK